MSPPERRALVDRDDPVLPIVAQCRLLKIARSTLYYQPAPVDPDDLAVMRRMDELYLASPFYGSRRMVAVLRRDGLVVNRKRARRLMRVMGKAGQGSSGAAVGMPDGGWRRYTRSRTPAEVIRITRCILTFYGACSSTGRTRFGVRTSRISRWRRDLSTWWR
jgi:putative transposase